MSTEPQSTAESEQEGESPNAKRMREQMEALKEQNNMLLGRVRLSAFKEAGLDPEQGGLNKAVYRTYEGDPDPEKIREFAEQEYDWKPPTPGPSAAQQRIQTIGAMGNSPEPRSTMDEAAAAAAEGDWIRSGALKDAELFAIAQRRTGYQ